MHAMDGDATGKVVFMTLPDRKHYAFQFNDIKSMVNFVEQAMRKNNVYITMTLQEASRNKEIKKERSVEASCCMFGLWADVDIKNDNNAHKAVNLPTVEEFSSFMKGFELKPTMVVDSGNGFHIYFLFKIPVVMRDHNERKQAAKFVEDFQRLLRVRMEIKGWKLDATADLARILRVAGTLNHKTKPPKNVVIQSIDENARYDAAALRATLDTLLKEIPVESVSVKQGKKSTAPKVAGPRPMPKHDQEAFGSGPMADAELIASGCAWVGHCVSEASSLPEPDWHHLATLLTRCVDGKEIFHRWSAPHEHYVREEAEVKFQQAQSAPGPVTCEFVHQELGFQACKGCNHFQCIKSPITLGIGNMLRTIFPDCPVDLLIPNAYVVNEDGIFAWTME